MNKVYLFLDFVGVLHPQPSISENLFCRLPLLEEVLREFPTVDIVISSSWREHYSLSELKDFFSADIQARVLAVTPYYRDPRFDHLADRAGDPEFERQWEIECWCEENMPHLTNWIAIDDYPKWFQPNCPNLLVTAASTGFVADDQNRLRQMIKVRLS